MIPRPPESENLNDGQRAALDLDRDLLVDAGAGAGKTLVLALRVLALIEHGCAAIAEIVAFTFTEKAAAEMRARVQELLLRRIAQLELMAKDSEVAERLVLLRRARAEFSQCRITTVHGFCHRLLAEHAWEANLEPRAPMLGDREQRLARHAAVVRVLTRTGSSDAEASAALTRLGAITRLGMLHETLDLMLQRRHEVAPALQRAVAAWADPPAELARRRRDYLAALVEAMAPCIAELGALPFARLNVVATEDKLRQKLVEISLALKAWPSVEAAQVLEAELLNEARKPRSFSTRSPKKWANAQDALEQATAGLARAAALLAEHAVEVLKYRIDDRHEHRCGRAAGDLAIVFTRVLAAYEEERGGLLDYLELELGALRLLRGDEALHESVCRRIRYLLIDEFQDTNPTQSELFALLVARAHRPGRLFAVGDAKQSIYGFRGADVGVFNDARAAIPARNEAAGVTGPLRLPFGLACDDTPKRRRGLVLLDANYRSSARLLEAGNALLASVLRREHYRRIDAAPQDLKPGRGVEGVARPVELHLLPQSRDEDAGSADEPELMARLAERLVGEGVKLSEIAILVRRRGRNAEIARAFARHRLPLVTLGESGLFETQEARDCVNVLRVLANPGDEIALLGLMRSPFGGLSDNALMALAPAEKEGPQPLRKRLETARFADPGDEAARQRLRASLGALLASAGRDAPSELLARALSDCGAGLAVSSGALAEQRAANLERMIEVVRELEPRFASLAALARELARRVEAGEDEAQGEPERGGEYVRLMTIHGAKGLEFPVVIVPEIGNALTGGDHGLLREVPPEGRALGLHLPWLGDDDARGKPQPDFEAWQASREAAEREHAEYRRLFYVAFTRAKDRLLLTGAVRNEIRRGKRSSWAEMLLDALECSGFGAKARELRGVQLAWHREIDCAPARSLAPDVQRIERALAGELELPREIDASLAAPLALPATSAQPEPEAAELGILVHAELERRVLARNRGLGVERAGGDIGLHADRAEAALATLRKARELPEWRIFGEGAERRIDLLRALSGDEYEIVDFKTDRVEPGKLRLHAEKEHGEQLREYAALLRRQLAARSKPPKKVRLLVCFTAPDLPADQRLVEIKEVV